MFMMAIELLRRGKNRIKPKYVPFHKRPKPPMKDIYPVDKQIEDMKKYAPKDEQNLICRYGECENKYTVTGVIDDKGGKLTLCPEHIYEYGLVIGERLVMVDLMRINMYNNKQKKDS